MQELSLKNFDSNPAVVSLNYNNVREYRSRIGGALSLTYIIIALVIIIFKLTDLIQRNHLTYTQNVIKDVDYNPLNISNGKFQICFYFIQKSNGTERRERIKFNERFTKGINVSILQYTIKKSGQPKQYKYPLVQCPYDDTYTYFCPPPKSIAENLSYSILGRVDFPYNISLNYSPIYTRYSLIVQTCDPRQPSCLKYQNDLYPLVIIHNNKIIPNATKHNETIIESGQIRQFQTKSAMNSSHLMQIQLFLQRIKVTTKNSILPQIFHADDSRNVQSSQTWFFDEQIQDYYSIAKTDAMMFHVLLRRSVFTHEYVRRYMKLDFILAEIFGLLGLFSLLFFGVYRGYNQYSLEQNIRKDLGLPYDKQTNIFKYYWYSIKKLTYRWLSCCLKNTQAYKQQQKSIKKISKKLNVSTFKHKKKVSSLIQQ